MSITSAGGMTLSCTTETSGLLTGALTTSGGFCASKAIIAGGNIHANYGGNSSGTPQIRVSPSTTNAESSVGWYTGTQASGNVWVMGVNVGSIGSNTCGLYSSTYGSTVIKWDTSGNVTTPYMPLCTNTPAAVGITCNNFTANQTAWTTITALNFGSSGWSFNGGSGNITLQGKGTWTVSGFFHGDAVFNSASLSYIHMQLLLSGTAVATTYRQFSYSIGVDTWGFHMTFSSTVTNETLTVQYKNSGAGAITNGYFNLYLTKVVSYT